MWTDQSIPTLDFDVYLTGFDVQTINMCDIFNGNLPRTADAGADPGDTASPNDGISNKGILSQDINFPGCSGRAWRRTPTRCLDGFRVTNLRLAHTGRNAPAYGGCLGFDYGDNIARGYITVDSVTQCNLLVPVERRVLLGRHRRHRATSSGVTTSTSSPTRTSPRARRWSTSRPAFRATATSATSATAPASARSRPATTPSTAVTLRWRARTSASRWRPPSRPGILNGGAFDGGTDLIVWRDAKTIPTGANGPYNCATASGPAWFPLNQTDVVAFDEQENPQDLCFVGDVVSPPLGGAETCFPLEAKRVSLQGGNVAGQDPTPAADFGWMYLNLNTTVAGVTYPAADPTIAQAWVTAVMRAEGRF